MKLNSRLEYNKLLIIYLGVSNLCLSCKAQLWTLLSVCYVSLFNCCLKPNCILLSSIFLFGGQCHFFRNSFSEWLAAGRYASPTKSPQLTLIPACPQELPKTHFPEKGLQYSWKYLPFTDRIFDGQIVYLTSIHAPFIFLILCKPPTKAQL